MRSLQGCRRLWQRARQHSSSSFASDNTRGVLPEVMMALQEANLPRSCASYGADEYSVAAAAAVRDFFSAPDAYVLPTVSGIASDALAIANATGPLDAVFCHRVSHIHLWQCGAVALYTGGAPLQPLGGMDGKICVNELARALRSAAPLAGSPYAHRPSLLSLTQPTEAGTLYSAAELRALSALAHEHGLLVHMDGARLPNALVALDATASAITWEAGIDLVSFGTTKGGTLAAEAVVAFECSAASALAMRRRRKRAGHELSKSRFVAAQICAYLADGDSGVPLWRSSAERANSSAASLARRLEEAAADFGYLGDAFQWQHPVQTNQLFLSLPCSPLGNTLVRALGTVGGTLWDSEKEGRQCVRLVTAFDTSEEEMAAAVGAFELALLEGAR